MNTFGVYPDCNPGIQMRLVNAIEAGHQCALGVLL